VWLTTPDQDVVKGSELAVGPIRLRSILTGASCCKNGSRRSTATSSRWRPRSLLCLCPRMHACILTSDVYIQMKMKLNGKRIDSRRHLRRVAELRGRREQPTEWRVSPEASSLFLLARTGHSPQCYVLLREFLPSNWGTSNGLSVTGWRSSYRRGGRASSVTDAQASTLH
jgi:hypothetical protein